MAKVCLFLTVFYDCSTFIGLFQTTSYYGYPGYSSHSPQEPQICWLQSHSPHEPQTCWLQSHSPPGTTYLLPPGSEICSLVLKVQGEIMTRDIILQDFEAMWTNDVTSVDNTVLPVPNAEVCLGSMLCEGPGIFRLVDIRAAVAGGAMMVFCWADGGGAGTADWAKPWLRWGKPSWDVDKYSAWLAAEGMKRLGWLKACCALMGPWFWCWLPKAGDCVWDRLKPKLGCVYFRWQQKKKQKFKNYFFLKIYCMCKWKWLNMYIL